MIYHSIFFMVASCSIGYLLLLYFYWKQMHALVPFVNLVMDAPHVLIILAIVGLILSFM